MGSSSSSLSPPPPLKSLHHVFPSFHGADIRKPFLRYMLEQFKSKGIDLFIENDIMRSKPIDSELIKAIRGSRMAIVLLSKNYASSTRCLDELVEIIKCREHLGQRVIVLFCKVDPTDVKKQTGSFGKFFRTTCQGKTEDDIIRWKQALAEVSKIAGYHSRNWDNEAEMIERIATTASEVFNNSTPSSDFKGLVGMKSHMINMEPLLRLDLEEVRMIGILGPRGIGKTTIARALFHQYSEDFQLCVFMENIKTILTPAAACSDDYSVKLYLQEKFISKLIEDDSFKILHLGTVKDILKDKKVLIVLDDVDQLVQLEAMAKETSWFGPSSRIIITTQDLRILQASGTNHTYKVNFPSRHEALQMFCIYAFDQTSPREGFTELARKVTRVAGDLPLGLRILGSYFRGMSKQGWKKGLPRVMRRLDGEIENILMSDYDALCDKDKSLFLHIACFFNEESVDTMVSCFENSFLDVRHGLHVLASKSLISMDKSIKMHKLLVRLGRELVRKQSLTKPGRRQFLVDARDIEKLSDDKADSSNVISIDLKFKKGDIPCTSERIFERVPNLHFLRIRGHGINPGSLDFISRKLILISWTYCQIPCFPSNFSPENLVKLDMRDSKLHKLWDGIKMLRSLKWMDLSYSRNLKELPDLSTATNLCDLDLTYCSSLVYIPLSLGDAISLRKLNLHSCSSLVELPSSIGNAINLQKLNLSHCSRLLELPSSIGNAISLQKLNLSHCSSLLELPSSIGKAMNLQELDVSNCTSLIELPSSIGNAINLQELDISNCALLVELPSSLENAINLQRLNLHNFSSLVELHSSSPFSSPNWKHHVFPSFHGGDVRKSFLSHILKEFKSKGINPFIDNDIERGKTISPKLIEAISGSRIAIVWLSKNYASSSWCLDELVEIIKCRKKFGQKVMVVFYEVDPTNVKKQARDFGKVFKETCKGKTNEDIGRWRQALKEVAEIVGYLSTNWDDEDDMIENIANDISNMLTVSTPPHDFNGLVGVRLHMEKIAPLLRLDLDDARMIGIWGPLGIGKTTIARVLYNQLSDGFELSVFMDEIKVRYPSLFDDDHNAKLQLQSELMSQVINQMDFKISHLGAVQDRLKDKKVLLVLDDVDNLGQLDALAKETSWFGPGSRIIITTQKKNLLYAHGISHIYEVGFPLRDEALQIFSMYAFGQKSPINGFWKLAREVTSLSGKHPLGLRFLGSYFRGLSKEEWTNELPRLRTRLDGEIQSIIKFTYDSSHDKEPSQPHISSSGDDELNEKLEESPAKDLSEASKEHIITSQDIEEDLYPSETTLEGIPSGLLHAVYIYCPYTLQYSFASYLSMGFHQKGIYASVNYNEALDVMERVTSSVVIFSKSCLSSTSCMYKLVRVFRRQRKAGKLVIPVFYGISPSDVVVHEHDESTDWLREWNSALLELRELPGHQTREECSEYDLVEEIVKDVYEKLFPAEQIGINLRLLEIKQLLRKQPWGIRRIGIWGMPGIGKTALAKSYFKQISGGYESFHFIEDFDKAFREKGIHHLFEEYFGEPRLSKTRTLVVLDDVKNPLVAESFIERFHWFGPGSLIIITSRDKQALRLCQINHVYEVQSLNKDEALQLFSQCAFGKDVREQKLKDLSVEVIDYASGNPFALSFYGKELKGKKLSEMESRFLKLKTRTPYNMYDLFKSSYDTLNDSEKNIFLDIACFFNGENVEYIKQLLEGCGFFPHVGIDVLVEKSLVSISKNRVKMHRIIQDFGRQIINRETVHIERRRRLWETWTIKFLLEDDKLEANGYPKEISKRAMGTQETEGIFLDTSTLLFDVKPTAFKNMLNLRFLKIYFSNSAMHSGLCLPQGLESLPNDLRLLHWENYPLQSLPQDFDPCHLVELNMPYSQLQKLWGRAKNLRTLKIVRLCHSRQLTEIDDICEAQYIELIDLQGCKMLQSFPATGQLQHLRVVNLSGCIEITSFPEVSPNIEELHLQGTGITELPESIVPLTKQAKFNRELSDLLTRFSGDSDALNEEQFRSLAKFVSSNQHLGKLIRLNLKDCSHLRSLPDMIDLESLRFLHLSGCSQLKDIQGFPRNLTELYLADTAVEKLPQLPQSLEVLNAHGCVSLKAIPFAYEQLPRYCTFSGCFLLSAQLISYFYLNAVANIEGIAREYKQEQELNNYLAFSFCLPSTAYYLPDGSSMILRLDPFSRSTFLGLFIFFEVAFSENYHEDTGFDVMCVRKWQNKETVSCSLEQTFSCWTPGEGVPKFQKDHIFFFCDLNLEPLSGKEQDQDIFADVVTFEFFPVDKEKKLIESCKVTKCGVLPTKGMADLKSISKNAL